MEPKLTSKSKQWAYKKFDSLKDLINFINTNSLNQFDFKITSENGYTGPNSIYVLLYKE